MKRQRRFPPLLCALLVLLLTSCEPSDSPHARQLDIYSPESRQSGTISADDMSHKLLVLNYWAEWCKPCIEEMPELGRFARAEQNRAVVLGVNFDEKKGAALHEAMLKVGMTFPALTTSPATVFALPEINGLPTTLVLDEHGVLKEQLLGPQTYDSLQAAINRITKP